MNKNKITILASIIACLLIFFFWCFVIKEIKELKTDHKCYMMSDEEFYSSEQCKSYWSYRQVEKK